MKSSWPTYNIWYDELSVHQELQEKIKLYRYMSFEKFKLLLDKSKLFFAKASVLSDRIEGRYIFPEIAKEFLEYKNNTFVSCWTKNNPLNKSSLFLWELYDQEKDSVAIEISIDHLFSGLFQDKKFEKYLGKINYLDPDNVIYPEKYKANSLVPFS